MRNVVFNSLLATSLIACAGTGSLSVSNISVTCSSNILSSAGGYDDLDLRIRKAREEYVGLMRIRNNARKVSAVDKARRSVGSSNIFTKDQKRFFDNRRICVKRDTETIPGSVITTWYRNGKLDTKAPAVVTNALKSISGVIQNNPLRDRIEDLASQVTNLDIRATAAEARASIAEAKAERAERLKAWLVEQRDKALLPTTKAIYQEIIDRFDGDD